MTHAFIDDSKIKIVNGQGAEFQILIDASSNCYKNSRRLFYFFTTSFLVLVALTVYLAVFTETSFVKNLIPGAMAFASLIFLNKHKAISQTQANYWHQHVANFNLAKTQLQPQILRLQKELAQHESDMQQIRSQAKFNFKKQDLEMTA